MSELSEPQRPETPASPRASDIAVIYIAPHLAHRAWPDIKGYVRDVVEYCDGRRTMAQALAEMIEGHVTLWVAAEDGSKPVGFCTSRIVQYPELKMLVVEMLGGNDFDQWIEDMHFTLVEFARANSCAGLELIGRPGWAKKLRRFGWTQPFVTCELRI